MSKLGTDEDEDEAEEPQTTTINVRVTERQLAEIDAAWKEEGYTSRSEFLRHAIRDATNHPGASREMLASIAAEEYAIRKGDADAVSREEVLAMMDDG
jgi:Arc/MetJ-type ribon-helix-helix transcriptional regulator